MEKNPENWSDLNWVDITNELYPNAQSKLIVTFFHWWISARVPSELRSDVKGNQFTK